MPSQASSYLALAALSTLAVQSQAYKLTAWSEKGCAGEAQQTIESTFGGYCFYFDDKAASIQVEGAADDAQFLFHNNYPCNSDTQVGSWIGNVCFSQGETKLKAVNTGSLTIGTKQKREPAKRADYGRVESWLNGDCSGSPTNMIAFGGVNSPVTLNDVSSVRVSGVRDADVAFACSDSVCKVDNQVAPLVNDECVNVEGKDVRSAMVIGIPAKKARTVPSVHNPLLEMRELENEILKRQNGIECATEGLADYTDALRVGDNWQGDNGLACCCHIPGGPTSRTEGTAKASISEDIRCPGDPSGTPPSPTNCPLNCNQMRSYVYAIAATCKTEDGKTGGKAKDGQITLGAA